jgi:uncharacterized membrane protein YfcA
MKSSALLIKEQKGTLHSEEPPQFSPLSWSPKASLESSQLAVEALQASCSCTLQSVLASLSGVAYLLTISIRLHNFRAKVMTMFTFLSILTTAATGAIFLVTGFKQGGLIDRSLALISLAGVISIIIGGSVQMQVDRNQSRQFRVPSNQALCFVFRNNL